MPSNSLIPVPEKRSHTITAHGISLIDNYHWLRDPKFPEVSNPNIIKYLQSENDYFKSVMGPVQETLENVFEESKIWLKETDTTMPCRIGTYLYRHRFTQGNRFRTWLRQSVDGKDEEIILNENEFASDNANIIFAWPKPSLDHKQIAFGYNDDGTERFIVRFKNLETGELLSDTIENVGDFTWAADNQTLIYTAIDDQLRTLIVKSHKIGTTQVQDKIIYEESDPGMYMVISTTASGKFIRIMSWGRDTTEIRLVDADAPEREPQVVNQRRTGHQYYVDHREDHLYILTNDNHENFRLVKATDDAPTEENWQEVIPPSDDRCLMILECHRDFMMILERRKGLPQICILNYEGEEHLVTFPEDSYTIMPETEHALYRKDGYIKDFEADTIRITYSSLIMPQTIFDYHVSDRKLIKCKESDTPEGFNPSDYEVKRLMAPASDGVMVPISLVHRKNFLRDGKGHLFMLGYGSYGIPTDAGFEPWRMSLLDRGFAFAIAHVRGGGELGQTWYHAGNLLNKKRTFQDFIDCTEYLITEKYTSAGNIAIRGGSAGGLLIGAVLNMRPDLYRSAIAAVPFVDALNTQLDDSLPSTQGAYPSWGDPKRSKEVFEYISSYSPYENVEGKDYPHIMVTAGLGDPRVTYWEPAKWVAKLRELKTDNNKLILKINMDSGHFGSSGQFGIHRDWAEVIAFTLMAFDLLDS